MLDKIILISSSSIGTFVLSIVAFKYDLLKIKANTQSEVSRSEQDRIGTAERTIDLVEKLRLTMDRQFDEMQQEMTNLKQQLSKYINQCSTCTNNKIER